jgi:queuine/archaeosine tRNA-ribosyltransferase
MQGGVVPETARKGVIGFLTRMRCDGFAISRRGQRQLRAQGRDGVPQALPWGCARYHGDVGTPPDHCAGDAGEGIDMFGYIIPAQQTWGTYVRQAVRVRVYKPAPRRRSRRQSAVLTTTRNSGGAHHLFR